VRAAEPAAARVVSAQAGSASSSASSAAGDQAEMESGRESTAAVSCVRINFWYGAAEARIGSDPKAGGTTGGIGAPTGV